MKILFIAKGDLPDYQSDAVFHGGRTLFGENFIDANQIWYMYEDLKNQYWKQRVPNEGKSYGRGFTLCGNLKNLPINRDNIKKRILDKEFDYIVYGSFVRCNDYIQDVAKVYPPNKVVLIDGEDNQIIQKQFLKIGNLFKRELVSKSFKRLHPINFGIPLSKIVEKVSEKTQDWGTVIPGKMDTYIFFDEKSYYEDYQKSYFALTHKKGGWDCLRHYEILANGCVPYFPDIGHCPELTMYNFPKELCEEANKMVFDISESGGLDDEKYYKLANNLLNYTREHLTTGNVMNYILKTIL